MRIHFIAIGGAVMHNMAIALHKKGYTVSGSDDEIFDPAKSNLEKYGLLPPKQGWHPENITTDIDAVILGMHARKDNPELQKAQELGLKIYSFPAYTYEQTRQKTRIVVAGSHGKTTITSMIMYVMKAVGYPFDYLVGSSIDGFETMVHFEEKNKYVVIEGDEYLSSPLDSRSKFLHYKPHIAIISGIAWDHINVFPTFDSYLTTFRKFIESIEPQGHLFYYTHDTHLQTLKDANTAINILPYDEHPFEVINHQLHLKTDSGLIPLQIFGQHNLQNLQAAKLACNTIGIDDATFYKHIASFKGAGRRLQKIAENDSSILFLDFAHAPSKLKATTTSIKNQFPDRQLIACFELHTFSSLTKDFLSQYAGTIDAADVPVVYFDKHTLEHKKLPLLTKEEVQKNFANNRLQVFTDKQALHHFLLQQPMHNTNLLMMSSGTFSGLDIDLLAKEIIT